MKSWLAMMCLSFIIFGSQTIHADQYPEPQIKPSQPQNNKAFPGGDWKNSAHHKTKRNTHPKGFEPDMIKPKQFPGQDWKGSKKNAAHPDFDWKTGPKQKNTRATKSNSNQYPEPQIKPKQKKNKAFPGEDWKPKSSKKGTKHTAPDGFMPETF